MHVNTRYINSTRGTSSVRSNCRRPWSLLLCLCDVFRALSTTEPSWLCPEDLKFSASNPLQKTTCLAYNVDWNNHTEPANGNICTFPMVLFQLLSFAWCPLSPCSFQQTCTMCANQPLAFHFLSSASCLCFTFCLQPAACVSLFVFSQLLVFHFLSSPSCLHFTFCLLPWQEVGLQVITDLHVCGVAFDRLLYPVCQSAAYVSLFVFTIGRRLAFRL